MTAAADPIDTPPMFAVPESPARPAPRRSPSTGRPVWATYRPKTAGHCHDCLAYLHQNGGRGPVPAKARHKRTVGATTRLLCTEHAQQQREHDQGMTS